MLLKSLKKYALIPGAIAFSLATTSLSAFADEATTPLPDTSSSHTQPAQENGAANSSRIVKTPDGHVFMETPDGRIFMKTPDGRIFGVIVTPQGQTIIIPLQKPSKLQENANLLQSVAQRIYNYAYVGIDEKEIYHRILAAFPQETLENAGLDTKNLKQYAETENKLNDALNAIYQQIEEKDYDHITESVVSTLMESLDPHSGYTSPTDMQELRNRTDGNFGGLGIQVGVDDDGAVKIVAPMDNTPASKAGLLADDLITKIGEKSTEGMSLQDATELMRGKVNEPLTITIKRNGVELSPITLVRAIIERNPVTYSNIDGVGHIRLTEFSGNATKKVIEAIEKLEQQGVTSYALDLRFNPGGLLTEAANIADIFLDKEEIIVSQRDRHGNGNKYVADTKDYINGKPLVVLTNGASASASEIVAGALQYHGRAEIIGETTFGKGSVQTIMPVSRGVAKTTTALYFVAGKVSIQNTGVTPNVRVTFGEAAKIESVITREAVRPGTIPNPNPIRLHTVERECRPANDNKDLFNNLADKFYLGRGKDKVVDATLLCSIEQLNKANRLTIQNYTMPQQPSYPQANTPALTPLHRS